MRRWEPSGLPLAKIGSISKELRVNPVVLADIGAAGPLAWPFRALSLDHMTSIRFDPRPESIDVAKSENEYLVGFALSDVEATLTLFETAIGDSSSVFPPKQVVLETFKYSQASTPRVVRSTSSVRASTIDTLVAQGVIPAPNVMKIDTQGSELPILKGAERILESVQLIMVETWTHEVYDGISLDSQLTSFLEERGFRILDSVVAARWKFSESDGLINLLDRGVVTGYEKVFARLDPKTSNQQLHLAVLLDLFGYKAKALKLIESRLTDVEIFWYQFRNAFRPIQMVLRGLGSILTRLVRLG